MGRSHPLLPSRQSDCSLHLPANRQSTHPQSASDRTTLRASAPPSPPTKADGTQPPTPSISTIRLQPSPTSEPAIYSPSVCLLMASAPTHLFPIPSSDVAKPK